jgi:hypothetical protein
MPSMEPEKKFPKHLLKQLVGKTLLALLKKATWAVQQQARLKLEGLSQKLLQKKLPTLS